MAMAKITLIGMNNYTDGKIWEGLILPEGMDAEVVKNEIMLECGEFQLLYPDATFLEMQITHFFRKWKRTFEKWWEVDQVEYEPIFNLDVTATYTDEYSGKADSKKNNTASSQSDVSAFNSSSFQPESRTSGNNNNTSNSTDSHTNVRTEVRRGNQGVTKSQEMVLDEIRLRQWNIYKAIADLFATEFCVVIYE